MRNLSLTLILAAAICVSCNNESKNKSEGNSTTTTEVAQLTVASENAIEKYQCPMKCQGDTAYTTSGQCPVCKMDLVKL